MHFVAHDLSLYSICKEVSISPVGQELAYKSSFVPRPGPGAYGSCGSGGTVGGPLSVWSGANH